MSIYSFTQVNSGGYFIGPHAIIVRADNEDQAIELARDHGLDRDAAYCNCCGPRWCEIANEVKDVDAFLEMYSFLFKNGTTKEEWLKSGELVIDI